MNRNFLEVIIGAGVLVVAGFFLYFAYSHSSVKTASNGYELVAKFDRIDGLLVGSDVRVSGVKVGTIVSIDLDPQVYLAVVKFSVGPDVKLPVDSSAEIQSLGLLGDHYLSISPGGEEDILEAGAEVINTQSAVNLTDLIGKAIFSSGKKNNSSEEESESETSPSKKESSYQTSKDCVHETPPSQTETK